MCRSPAACPLCPPPAVSPLPPRGDWPQGQRTSVPALPLVPYIPSALPSGPHQAVGMDMGQLGCRGPGPHLPVVRRGHVPLAHPVAIVGIGVVCISNPLLGRNCL